MSVLARPDEMKIEVESHRGRVFTIAGWGAGADGVALGTEIDGMLGDSPFESIWNSHAFQQGADFGGIVEDKRDIAFGIHVKNTPDQSWEENDSEFRKAWHKKRDSKLWIETLHSRRHLKLRLSKTPEFNPKIDPIKVGYAGVVYHCTAGDPRWYEDDVIKTYTTTADTTGGGWEYGEIGPVWNPTDDEIWLVWELPGIQGMQVRLPDFSWGDDRMDRAVEDADRTVLMRPLFADDHVRIDTDETADQVQSSLNLPWYIYMDGVTFCYPVPEYSDPVMLPVAVTGAPVGTKIRVRQPRPWSRPFGLQ